MYETSRKVTAPAASKRPISAHNIVVVRAAAKEVGIEKDPELQRIQVWLQSIFLFFSGLILKPYKCYLENVFVQVCCDVIFLVVFLFL